MELKNAERPEPDSFFRRRLNKKEKEDLLKLPVAGETVSFADYERFAESTHPKTLEDLMITTEVEAKLSALQGRILSPSAMKILIGVTIAITFVIVGAYIMQQMGWIHF